MMYLYDGNRLIGIECRTWDSEEHRYLYAETEENGILQPECENLPVLASVGPVKSGYVYAVIDVQWYIDEAEAWQNYENGAAGYFAEEEGGEADRYERCADVTELDVAAFEAAYSVYEEYAPGERPTIEEVKKAIAKEK